ncbi:ABC transporter, ATP-binding protein [Sinorhizobium meliloti CCNWSX0020]|uniref:Glutathione import ATP-binding protein GsiA n=1 Tax=Sinorhizobium meliloti CCNWSX0020 TaxID=1107881 RepID=H0FSH2_RHIML|nr:ATP-binding cassette domain-containing protein [Sinorhizobium meliloti]EHK79922.1 ABC transporter, ATP-binding protein [Sinorhizobium meliloti CCNWSX0020]RVG73948.1 ABC transporter ATP-binding protein [Sinorhizobium meliloti]RVH38046.1 ABC transporter ATP-binding protein [Sinorhizobium meliloti]RVH51620.1 ABC transporter ATP-binding protein [Sinorhizobium meliloti]
MTDPLLEVDDLHVRFSVSGGGLLGTGRRMLHAVNGIGFSLAKGECLSIVGESGCGKSTTALSVLGLQEPTEGTIRYRGQPLTGPGAPGRMQRAKAVQMVFQDPYASLNPRQSVRTSLAAPLRLHGITAASEIADRIEVMLANVGLTPEQANRYPHEFSGGQRQRIGIARALILEPEIVVLDEPVSALDVSIRAQIINLLLDLQEKLGLGYLMISHDLSVVEHMSDRVLVMFFGQVVEEGGWRDIFERPAHPYTRRLIAAIPDPDAALNPGTKDHFADVPLPAGRSFAVDGSTAPDVFCAPPPSELVEIAPGHRMRLVPAV